MSQAERPWTQDEIDDEVVDDVDELDVALMNCSGFLDGGVFVCGAAGSEDCDWDCPFSRDIGLTEKQIEQRELEEEGGMDEPELWLAVAYGEQCGETRICRSLAEVVDFLWLQCGPDASGDEATTRKNWAEYLANEDNWVLADGYDRWRCDIDVGETGKITIQRMTMDAPAYAAPDLLEALRDAEELLVEVEFDKDPPLSFVRRLEAVRAAIAKATPAPKQGSPSP